MSTACRAAAAAAVVAALGLGLARSASTDVEARAAAARERLGVTAREAGVTMQANAEPTPTVNLAVLVGVQPGATAPLNAPGRYTAGSSASMSRGPFTLSNAAVTATAVTGTMTAAPNALPAVGRLEVVTPGHTRRAAADVAFVAGRWTFAMKASNGWRIEIATDAVTPQNATSSIPASAKFFKSAEATPFETRKGTLSGDESGTSASISLSENIPGASAECDRVTARYQQIAQALGTSPNETLMAEFEKMSDKFTACMEQQQKAVMEHVQKAQDPAFQASEKARHDNFGCDHVSIETGADGTLTGRASCGANVGQLALTGTMTHGAQ